MLNINHFIYLKQDTIFLTKVLLKMLSVILLVAKLLKIKVNMSLFLHWININIVLVEGFKFNNYMYNNIRYIGVS